MGPRIAEKRPAARGVRRADAAAGARRPGPRAADRRQPAHQRAPVHAGGRADPRRRRGRPRVGPDRRRGLGGRDDAPRRPRTCSSASTAARRRSAHAARPGRGSGCRSSSRSSTYTTARSKSTRSRAAGPRSGCCCRRRCRGPESARALEAIRGRRVLVVDDEREIAELIAGQLAPLEVDATIATSGEEALALRSLDHFDAITLDILMPGHGRVRGAARDPRRPRAARDPDRVRVGVLRSPGARGEWVVSKPIDADELRDVLGAAVSAGRSRVLVVGREELQPHARAGARRARDRARVGDDRAAAARAYAASGASRSRSSTSASATRRRSLQALDLRGRRLRRAVILFSDGVTRRPAGDRQARDGGGPGRAGGLRAARGAARGCAQRDG